MPAKLTTSRFIEKARFRHGAKYDYTKAEYDGYSKILIIICTIHGEFSQTAGDHLRGNGCQKCGRENTINSRKSSTEDFIRKATSKHAGKFTYDNAEYVSNHVHVSITCRIHGDWPQTPANHLSGHGCPRCAGRSVTNRTEGRVLDLKSFVIRSNAVHLDAYDYTKTVYERSDLKVTITCPIHGDFSQTPNSHIQGHGCKQCGIESRSAKKRFKISDFLRKANNAHEKRYGYDWVEYAGANSPVLIDCKLHGLFSQLPAHHWNGGGCLKCSYIERGKNRRKSTAEFIQEAINEHGDKYDYSRANYELGTTDIVILCKIHGSFMQTPVSHLSGSGCPLCGWENFLKNRLKTTEQFIIEAKLIHGERYSYQFVDYENGWTPVRIECSSHGIFDQNPTSHLQGHGCKKCGLNSLANLKTKTTTQFVSEAITVHGSRYDYSLVEYESGLTPVTIICDFHGEFKQKPTSHLQGHGCIECAWMEHPGSLGRNSWPPETPFNFYLVRFSHPSGEKFLKVGLTRRTVKSRFTHVPDYAIETIIFLKSNYGVAWELEQSVLKHLRKMRWMHWPRHSMNSQGGTNGNTECAKDTIEVLKYVRSRIGKIQ